MGRAFAIAYVVLVGALMVCALAIWRIRCEGFGCTGVGIAWLAWVAFSAPTLIAGIVLQSSSSLGPALARLTKLALCLQAATGVALLAVWASGRSA